MVRSRLSLAILLLLPIMLPEGLTETGLCEMAIIDAADTPSSSVANGIAEWLSLGMLIFMLFQRTSVIGSSKPVDYLEVAIMWYLVITMVRSQCFKSRRESIPCYEAYPSGFDIMNK